MAHVHQASVGMSDSVIETRSDAVVVLTMNAPARRNAISQDMRMRLASALERAAADPACRAIVLTGASETFSAGADISELEAPAGTDPTEYADQRLRQIQAIPRLIVTCGKPIVAAVEGSAAGAGLSLAAACDYVVAGRDARFIASFVRLGLVPDCGLIWSLPRRVGHARAQDILLTGRPVLADEAFRIGLADEIAQSGTVLDAAVCKAALLGTAAPLAIRETKHLLGLAPTTLEAALDVEARAQRILRKTSDHAEAKRAFLEKRDPAFRGH